jgi:hypothetical protein
MNNQKLLCENRAPKGWTCENCVHLHYIDADCKAFCELFDWTVMDSTVEPFEQTPFKCEDCLDAGALADSTTMVWRCPYRDGRKCDCRINGICKCHYKYAGCSHDAAIVADSMAAERAEGE